MAKDRMKERHDRRVTSEHLYEVGQLVWLNVRNISIRHPTLIKKLLPKFLGPLKVRLKVRSYWTKCGEIRHA